MNLTPPKPDLLAELEARLQSEFPVRKVQTMYPGETPIYEKQIEPYVKTGSKSRQKRRG